MKQNKHIVVETVIIKIYASDDADDNYEISQNSSDNIITVDYELTQMIQQKVSSFSVEKTREQLEG